MTQGQNVIKAAVVGFLLGWSAVGVYFLFDSQEGMKAEIAYLQRQHHITDSMQQHLQSEIDSLRNPLKSLFEQVYMENLKRGYPVTQLPPTP